MGRSFSLFNNFTGGRLTPRLGLRTDFTRYQNGADTIDNFIVLPQGAITSRPGFEFKAPVKHHDKITRLLRFEFNTNDAYVIEMGENYFRFFRNGEQVRLTGQSITGITQANPAVVTYSGADTYANGDPIFITDVGGMTQVNNREFTVANVDTVNNTFELSGVDSSGYDAYTSGGTVEEIYELAHTYQESELRDLRYTQSADIVFLFHGNHPVRELSRTADTSWALAESPIVDGPYLEENTTDTTLSFSAGTGTVTVTASASLFSTTDTTGTGGTGDYDRLIRVQARNPGVTITNITAADPPRVTWSGDAKFADGQTVYISGVSGMTEVNGNTYEIDNVDNTGKKFDLKNVNGSGFTAYTSGGTIEKLTDDWVWMKITGYTSATVVTAEIQEDGKLGSTGPYTNYRLGAWSTTTGLPWMGKFFENRLVTARTATDPDTIWASGTDDYTGFGPGTDDDDPWSFTILSDGLDAIQWINPQRQLRVGTVGSEYTISSGTSDQGITPTSVNVQRHTGFGSAFVEPVLIQNSTLFWQRTSRKLREFVFNFSEDSFVAPDLTIASEDLPRPGALEMAYQAEPDGILWVAKTDGELIGLTYLRDQDVIGWHRHPLGGTDAKVKSVTTIPGSDYTELWVITERTIDGATVQYVERMSEPFVDKTIEDAKFSDSFFAYDGSAVGEITGLNHLEGETVTLLADGGTHPDRTVTNGKITLDKDYSTVTIGLPYTQKLITLDLDGRSQLGTTQGSRSRVTELVLHFFETVGAKYRGTNGDLATLDFRVPSNNQDEGVPLFSGIKKVRPPKGYADKVVLEIQQAQPLPMTLLGFVAKMESSDAP